MHNEIINALGGTRKTAKLFNVVDSAVTRWRTEGISWRYRSKAASLARAAGVDVPDSYLDPDAQE